jgi:hypothetical protein
MMRLNLFIMNQNWCRYDTTPAPTKRGDSLASKKQRYQGLHGLCCWTTAVDTSHDSRRGVVCDAILDLRWSWTALHTKLALCIPTHNSWSVRRSPLECIWYLPRLFRIRVPYSLTMRTRLALAAKEDPTDESRLRLEPKWQKVLSILKHNLTT